MTTSFYELSVGSFRQAVTGMQRTLAKGASFASQKGLDVNDFLDSRVHETMLPFLFQVNCVPLHSVDAIAGIRAGEFSPPKSTEQRSYNELQQLMIDTEQALESLAEEEVNGLAGNTVIFKFAGKEIPFTAGNFVMSFSIPNLYFHIATAYDILRQHGVPLSKADYLGKLRIGA